MALQFYLIIGLIYQLITFTQSISYSEFAVDLFYNVANLNKNTNVIISPASIQTCLGMVFMGAEGTTADQLAQHLYLQSTNKLKVQNEFKKLSDNISQSQVLKMANKMYLKKNTKVHSNFYKSSIEAFNSKPELIDFNNNQQTANLINQWISSNTNNKIQNLIDPNSISNDMNILLVNAIYFHAEWQNRFQSELTQPGEFWLNNNQKITTNMMFNDMYYKWADIQELDATALEMPYKDTDLTMFFLLPNQRNGLSDLLMKLRAINLLDMADTVLNSQFCEVYIPRFKIEFGVNLNQPLKNMGITEMFSSNANLPYISENGPVKISDVQHKAYISVNEFGSEAAGATFVKIVPLLGHSTTKVFRLDHPFVYVIKDKNQIYFIGQIVNIPQ